MTDLSTVDLHTTKLPEMDVSSTGRWSQSSIQRPEQAGFINRLGPVAGLVFALMASPATAVPDVWFIERRRRDVITAVQIMEDVIGRPISRAEALRIARRILDQAERERLELAEFEAVRGIQWGAEA